MGRFDPQTQEWRSELVDKTTLSSFINQAQPQDFSAIASQLFSRVGSLDQRQQDQFMGAGSARSCDQARVREDADLQSVKPPVD